MSRLYITASMKHTSLGISLPVLSVDTADHTGGGYHLKGVHPASLAAMGGRGPEVKKGERFDFKFNINAQRTSVALVVNTTKHLPHLEWSSEGGMGKLPLGISTVVPLLLSNGRPASKGIIKDKKNYAKGEGAATKSSKRSGKSKRYHSPSRSSRSDRRGDPEREYPKAIKAPERRDATYGDYADDGEDVYAGNEDGRHGVESYGRRHGSVREKHAHNDSGYGSSQYGHERRREKESNRDRDRRYEDDSYRDFGYKREQSQARRSR